MVVVVVVVVAAAAAAAAAAASSSSKQKPKRKVVIKLESLGDVARSNGVTLTSHVLLTAPVSKDKSTASSNGSEK